MSYSFSNASNCCSSSTVTPSSRALSYFEPGSEPTTTSEVFFETEANRQKFLDNLPQAVDIVLTGDIIEDAFKNQLEFKVPEIRYSAYPYGNLEDLLGAKVVFQAQYNAAAGYSMQAVLTNAISGY